jgi:hypothetical protein
MKNKFSVLGMLAIVLLFNGCNTVSNLILGEKEVETETSKLLFDGATDLILAKEDGIAPDVFKASFTKKFTGLEINSSGSLSSMSTTITCTYQDKKFRMQFTGRDKDGLSSAAGGTWTYITSVVSCKELQKKEAQ